MIQASIYGRLGRDPQQRQTKTGPERFGRWTVLEAYLKQCGKQKRTFCICKCDCGTVRHVIKKDMMRGKSTGCGCSARTAKHYHAKEYRVWSGMIQRCSNPNAAGYKHYGERGIKVCDRWRVFDNFFDDIGEIPEGLQIDRINNDGDYEQGNVRLVSRSENMRNTRDSSWWHIDGMKFDSCVTAAQYFGVSKDAIISWCSGYTIHGVRYPAWEGCYKVPKYPKTTVR